MQIVCFTDKDLERQDAPNRNCDRLFNDNSVSTRIRSALLLVCSDVFNNSNFWSDSDVYTCTCLRYMIICHCTESTCDHLTPVATKIQLYASRGLRFLCASSVRSPPGLGLSRSIPAAHDASGKEKFQLARSPFASICHVQSLSALDTLCGAL